MSTTAERDTAIPSVPSAPSTARTTSIAALHPGSGDETATFRLLGRTVSVRRIGCADDPRLAGDWIETLDGKVDVLALDGFPIQLELGGVQSAHRLGTALAQRARRTPVVDGSGIRAALERWAVTLADRAQPGIFSQKRILMVPGLNHGGLAQALGRFSRHLRYADPALFFHLPSFLGIGHWRTLLSAAPPTLAQVKTMRLDRLSHIDHRSAHPGDCRQRVRAAAAFFWADVLAGDIGAIRRFAPARLKHKTVVVEWATEEDLEDLRQRGVSIAVTLMPSPDGRNGEVGLGRWSAAVCEAALSSLRPDPRAPVSEDAYLDLLAELDWTPAIRSLQPAEAGIHRYAFVIHPLHIGFIHKDPKYRWTRFLPDALVEEIGAWMPPRFLSRITGGRSKATGQRIEGVLFTLSATPRKILAKGERFTYKRLNQAARMAERMGARIMGLGAFTKVVGDAGITVAHEAGIAVTSGNSLTVAATLEAAKQAVLKMGATDLTHGRAMIVGATGAIGAVCSRLIAQAVHDVVLVSIEPERLIALKRRILAETPGARVQIATRPGDLLASCDLVVTATSAFGQRVLDLSGCKPGAVICDVALPADISPEEAATRPDLLVIESGEVLIPGNVDFGYDIGLPPGVAYACLAEAALLAMEGRFEDFTLGRNIEMERVKEIYHLFHKHGFELAGLRSFGRYLTEEDLAAKRAAAERLRSDPDHFAQVQAAAAIRIAAIPPKSKGMARKKKSRGWMRLALAAGVVGVGVGIWRRKRRGEGR